MNPADVMRNLYSDVRGMVDSVRADRAVAQGTQSAGLITILRLESTVKDLEQYARVKGFATADQDEVVLLEMKGGKTFVLGTLQRTAPTGYALDAVLNAGAGIVNSDSPPTSKQQATSDTPSTNAVSTFWDAIAMNVVLPPGTFTLWLFGWIFLTRTPVGNAQLRALIDGSPYGGYADTPDPAIFTPRFLITSATGVAGNRTVVCKGQYTGSAGVTLTSAKLPGLWVTAERTA